MAMRNKRKYGFDPYYRSEPFKRPRTSGYASNVRGSVPVYRDQVDRQVPIYPTKNMIRKSSGEKKGVDVELNLTPVLATTNTNGSVFLLNGIVPGNGSWNRVGRKAYLKSVRLWGIFSTTFVRQAGTGDYGSNVARMVVVWDKQPSGGTLPTYDTIFGTTTQAGTESTDIWDPVKYDNMGRFQILKSCTINMPCFAAGLAADSDVVTQNYPFDEYIKLGNKESIYSGQSDPCTIADISTGALYVYFRALVNAATNSVVTVTADSKSRLRYSD